MQLLCICILVSLSIGVPLLIIALRITVAVRYWVNLVSCRVFERHGAHPMLQHILLPIFNSTSIILVPHTGIRGFNDNLHHTERRRVFNLDGLCHLVAKSVDPSPHDVLHLEKLAEGSINRTFLIDTCDDFPMIARIPYLKRSPIIFLWPLKLQLWTFYVPLDFMCLRYSPVPNDIAETKCIFVKGTTLSDIWSELEEHDISSSRT